MNTSTTLLKTAFFAFLMLLAVTSVAQLRYTAVKSGSWSDASTWGNAAPGNSVSLKSVEIPIGITVTLDANIEVNSALLGITVNGTLNGLTSNGSAYSVNLKAGKLQGSGTINVDSLNLGAGSILELGNTTQVSCNILTNRNSLVSVNAGNFTIRDKIILISGVLKISGSAAVQLSDNCKVLMKGGRIENSSLSSTFNNINVAVSGDVDTLRNDFATTIDGGNVTFQSLDFDFEDSTKVVYLGGNTDIKGDLNLANGVLDLAGKELNIDGNLSVTNGRIRGSHTSSVKIAGHGRLDALKFERGSEVLGALKINRDTVVRLGSDLSVRDSLVIKSGRLDLGERALTIEGGLFLGTATLIGGDKARLTLKGNGTIDPLNFEPGSNKLDELDVNVDALKQVVLASDIEIKGRLLTTSGEIVLEDNTLTISGSIEKDKGLIVGNASASIVIQGAGVAGTLGFKEGHEQLRKLQVDRAGDANRVGLTGSLTVKDSLVLTNGVLYAEKATKGAAGGTVPGSKKGGDDNGEVNLNIDGTLTTSPNGRIGSNGNLNVHLSGEGTVDTLYFAEDADTLKSLNNEKDQAIQLGSDLVVADTLNLAAGELAVNNHTLTVNGTVTGNGTITCDGTSALHFAGTAVDTLKLTTGSDLLRKLVLDRAGNGKVILTRAIEIRDTLKLAAGELDISNVLVTINGKVESGKGTLSGGREASLKLTGTGDAGSLAFTENRRELKSLEIDRASNGQVTLDTELRIDSILHLANGKVRLNDHDLVIDSLANISGAGKDNYIVTSENAGRLARRILTANAEIDYPVGTLLQYAPARIKIKDAAKLGEYRTRAFDGVRADGENGENIAAFANVVDMTWDFSSELAEVNVDLTVEWGTDLEKNAFDRNNCFLSHYVNGAWDSIATVAATEVSTGRYELSRANVTSFSPYAVGSDVITGVQEAVSSGDRLIYPNPASAHVFVNGNSISQIAIYDITGTLVESFQPVQGAEKHAIGHLGDGLYICRIIQSNGVMTSQKLMVAR